ncbi:MAG TPA: S8 family serine peptidase, partial [Xanthomonadales bacterium]|nr:S8 family serine peptidase [Xanthomonadales bacterium]
ASGNDGSKNAVRQPGCISSAISVGNTTDADSIADSSNVANFLDLLAPGSNIISAFPGGSEITNSGTSMSAPHVAGAWAVLRQAHPAASIDEILQALRMTGTSVNDQRIGGTVTDMRRINLDLALDWLATLEPEIETHPVSGSELDFGQVRIDETSASQIIQLSNIGDGDLVIQSCDLQGAAVASFISSPCPANIPAGTQAELELQCQPQAMDELSAQLHINSNDADEALLSFELKCVGLSSDHVFVDSFEQPVP